MSVTAFPGRAFFSRLQKIDDLNFTVCFFVCQLRVYSANHKQILICICAALYINNCVVRRSRNNVVRNASVQLNKAEILCAAVRQVHYTRTTSADIILPRVMINNKVILMETCVITYYTRRVYVNECHYFYTAKTRVTYIITSFDKVSRGSHISSPTCAIIANRIYKLNILQRLIHTQTFVARINKFCFIQGCDRDVNIELYIQYLCTGQSLCWIYNNI